MSQPSIQSQNSTSSSSPVHKVPVRPRIILPNAAGGTASGVLTTSPHYNNNPLYITPPAGTGINMPTNMHQPMTPAANTAFLNDPFNGMPYYPAKAGEFMFKQFSGFKDFTMNMANSGLSLGEKSAFWMYNKVSTWSRKWFTHIFLFLVIALYSIAGALIFVAIEAPFEQQELLRIRAERIQVVKELWNMTHWDMGPEPDPEARRLHFAISRLRSFEKLIIDDYDKGIEDKKQIHGDWTFWNAVFYCGTIYTTIGYGHITPATATGRAITIVYAVFGIPMFLILLADFGKLFTRGIKFIWAFVRRLYYTGSCRKVRKTETVQDVMKGVQMVYEIATFRRPSQQIDGNAAGDVAVFNDLTKTPPKASSEGGSSKLTVDGCKLMAETPNTPAPSNFAVDDEFNLPVSVAIVILIMYLLSGASMYYLWEDWSFFESFYFVFISMSTIGFGDFVPNHPMYMMASILYLVFGLALTSMCINVVQVKLSDTFRQASAKIGATIGLATLDDDGSITAAQQIPTTTTPEIQQNAKTNL